MEMMVSFIASPLFLRKKPLVHIKRRLGEPQG
jgi:hypothetical protein